MNDSNMPTIDSKNLREKIKNNSIRIIDVRRDQEYQQGHITNAVNLPLAKLLNDDSPESIQKIAQDLGISNETPVVIYDDTLSKWIDRVVKGNESSKITGVEDIKKEIAPLIVPPKVEDEPDFYMDFGSDTNYHTVTGKGECAA